MMHRLLRWLRASEPVPHWALIWLWGVMLLGIGLTILLAAALFRCGC